MFREYYEKLLKQLAIEFNCSPSDFLEKGNFITSPAMNEGRRLYSNDKPFLQMATLGFSSVFMAGCSEDGPHWQQIGIDVMPEYRSKGIGTYLVTLLKNKPAWVETEEEKIDK